MPAGAGLGGAGGAARAGGGGSGAGPRGGGGGGGRGGGGRDGPGGGEDGRAHGCPSLSSTRHVRRHDPSPRRAERRSRWVRAQSCEVPPRTSEASALPARRARSIASRKAV